MKRRIFARLAVLPLLATACASGDTDPFAATSGGFTTAGPTSGTSGTSQTDSDGGETGEGHADDTGGTEDGAPPEATCDDQEQNQGETDLDCGGPNCEGCESGESCDEDADCASESCVGNVCVTPDCSDGVMNGDETDVDCGGSCGECGDNLGCEDADDCESGVCTAGTCTPPSCADSVLNGEETDLDCGGSTCSGCDTGEMCDGDSDCISQDCPGGTCAELVCQNDADCDEFDGDCTEGQCSQNACMSVAANENQDCDSGDLCLSGTTCSQGACGGGAPVDCSNLSDQCNVGVCDPQDGMCNAEIANEGNPCDDGSSCTVNEECDAGTCIDPNAPGYFFYEDFENNSAGWTLGPEWAIGAASASNCASSCPGNDPGQDHTDTNDNGIAGVLIGACQPKVVHADYWLTSPKIDTPNDGEDVFVTYWRHLHTDYSPYMVSKFQYSVDNSNWTTLYTTANTCVNDNAWTEQSHELPLAANASEVYLRWGYSIGSTGVFSAGIWNVDDVTVGPAVCTP